MRNTAYIKLMASFAGVALIIFLTIQLLYVSGRREMVRQITSSSERQLDAAAKGLEEEVYNIGSYAYDCFESIGIYLLGIYKYNVSDNRLNEYLVAINRKMEDTLNKSPLIDNIAAVLNAPDSTRTYIASSLARQKFELEIQEVLKSVSAGGRHIQTRVYLNSGLYVICASRSDSDGIWRAVVVKLSSTEIAKRLKAYVEGFDDEIIMISDDGEFTVNAAGSMNSGDTVTSEMYSSALSATFIKETGIVRNTQFIYDYRNMYLLTSLLLFILIILFILASNRLIQHPLKMLVDAMNHVKENRYSHYIKYKNSTNFQGIFDTYNSMLDQMQYMIEEVYEKTILTQRAELRQLQTQIDPHFLYNSLYTQRRMIEMADYEGLKEFTQHLGDYFMFLHSGHNDSTELRTEVEHVRAYCAIQQIRFRRRICIEFGELPVEYACLKIPRLILQPIVENAFKYSLENKTEGGILRICFKPGIKQIEIVIEDNGAIDIGDVTKIEGKISETVAPHRISALGNINKRLKLVFGENSGLSFRVSALGGLCVEIRILTDENGDS